MLPPIAVAVAVKEIAWIAFLAGNHSCRKDVVWLLGILRR